MGNDCLISNKPQAANFAEKVDATVRKDGWYVLTPMQMSKLTKKFEGFGPATQQDAIGRMDGVADKLHDQDHLDAAIAVRNFAKDLQSIRDNGETPAQCVAGKLKVEPDKNKVIQGLKKAKSDFEADAKDFGEKYREAQIDGQPPVLPPPPKLED